LGEGGHTKNNQTAGHRGGPPKTALLRWGGLKGREERKLVPEPIPKNTKNLE